LSATETGTVGATRDFLAEHYGVPHQDNTHFVIVAEAVNGTTVGTCCDGSEEIEGLLRLALHSLGAAQPPLAAESPSVIVGRADLETVLRARPCCSADALGRLRAALGTEAGSEH
jgi:hypothetical protein